jgi:hypothetical protein
MRHRYMSTPRMSLAGWMAIVVFIGTAIYLPGFLNHTGMDTSTNELMQWKVRAIVACVFIPCAWWMARMDLMDKVRAKLNGHEFLGRLYYTKDQELEDALWRLRRTLGHDTFDPHDYDVVNEANQFIRRHGAIRNMEARLKQLGAQLKETE